MGGTVGTAVGERHGRQAFGIHPRSQARARRRAEAAFTAYRVIVSPESRSPAFLAALASAAVPGLDPVSVRAVPPGPSSDCDTALVVDDRDRSWIIRSPRTPAAGARLESAATLVGLLARRLPFAVPVPKGFVTVPNGRAAVYPRLPGRALVLERLAAGPGLGAELGRAIAAIHNLDPEVFEEAGTPAYDADTYRTRRLAELDRAATTGHVPTALLSRWEAALEDVTLWRFAPAPVHGGLTGSQVLAVFDSDADPTTGHVRAVLGWEDAKIADPAEDFAAVLSQVGPGPLESVLEAYANSRSGRPDPHLRRRALLAGELALLGNLLSAVTAGPPHRVRWVAEQLAQLARTVDERDLSAPAPVSVVPRDVRIPAPQARPGPADEAGATTTDQPTVGMDPRRVFGATQDADSTVAMDPRTIFDATEEIPEEQLAAARARSRDRAAEVPADDDSADAAEAAGVSVPEVQAAEVQAANDSADDADAGPDGTAGSSGSAGQRPSTPGR